MKKLLFLISEDWHFWSHRRSIAIAAREEAYQVTLITRVNEKEDEINGLGIKLIPTRMKRSSLNPFFELGTIIELIGIYRREKPDIVHHVAIKPIVYGTLAAKLTGVPHIVNALGGMGHIFSSPEGKMRIMRGIVSVFYRFAFSGKSNRLILQNPDDKKIVLENKLTSPSKITIIRGSGADLTYFKYLPEPPGDPVILYAGRLLWSKGIGDLYQASEILSKKNIKFKSVLVGKPDPENPETISESQIEEWCNSDYFEWWGHHEDMPSVLGQSSIVVLPAIFREGLPKILIEAAAVGRPLIATDMPGCREIVKHGWNGLLIPSQDPDALANAIMDLLSDHSLRQQMGKNSRELAENEFSEDMVIDQTLALYKELVR